MSDQATTSNPVRDCAERSRFELDVGGQVVFADYWRHGSTVVIPHVEAPRPLRGTGAASRLLEGIMERARAEGFKVKPFCGYAAHWLRRRPQYRDLMA